MAKRVRARSAVLIASVAGLGLLGSFLAPCPSYAQTEEVKAKGRAALAASNEGELDEAYRLWMELVTLGPSSVGEEIYSFARSYVYRTAMFKIEQLGDSNCTKSLEWVEKGRRPGPPKYKEVYDVFYSTLLIARGVCYAREERYEEAYSSLVSAKEELRQAPADEASEFIQEAEQYLSSVQEHVISTGDYVTNRGALQAWIGKVRSRSGEELEIFITYANKALAAEFVTKGSTLRFAASNCKKLGAISPDALVKGWKE